MPSSIKNEQQFYDYFVPIFFLTCFIVSLPKKLTALRYASFVTAIINVFIAIVMIIDRSNFHDYNESQGASFSTINLNTNIFGCYCLSLFSVVNQFSVVNILAEYQNPNQRRINKVSLQLTLACIKSSFAPTLCLLNCSMDGLCQLWFKHTRYYHQQSRSSS